MIHTLSSHAHKRKSKLNILLTNSADELSLERQHQITGAITEIDVILGILNNHKKREIQSETNPDDDVFLLKPIQSKGMVKDTIKFVKDMF